MVNLWPADCRRAAKRATAMWSRPARAITPCKHGGCLRFRSHGARAPRFESLRSPMHSTSPMPPHQNQRNGGVSAACPRAMTFKQAHMTALASGNWIRERGAGQRAGGTADSRDSELHANHVQSTGCCGGKQTIRLPRGAAEAWPAPDKSQRLSFLVHRSGLLHCRRKKHSLSGALIRTDRTRNVKCPLGTIFRATSWPNCFSKRFWSF